MFDLEANGLLDTVDRIWCGVFKEVTTGTVVKAYGEDVDDRLRAILLEGHTLIGHNIIDYDIALLIQLLGTNFDHVQFYDTFLMSMMSFPDRKRHPNCPSKKQAHSLANFGAIFGQPKPEHEDWHVWSPEMLYRCEQDVEINYKTWFYLIKEMGCDLEAAKRGELIG